MNVLVAYATRLGSTHGIAERVAARLSSHGLTATVEDVESVSDVRRFDAVVLGSAVYAGSLLDHAVDFADRHREALVGRPVWLFCSGPVGHLATSFDPAAPGEIDDLARLLAARGTRVFAGALDRRTIDRGGFGFGERFIARRFVPEGDYRNWEAIDAWADEIATALSSVPA
jgi:menaquinone-dependent protoporphyrinogen oxidase